MSLFLEQWAVSGGLGAGTDMITRPFSKPPLAARWGGGRANRWGEAGQADTRREGGPGLLFTRLFTSPCSACLLLVRSRLG